MVREITASELARLLVDGRCILIDVRQPWENQLARIPDSTLIPLGELANRWREIRADDGALLIVYCHHGIRSLSAAEYLLRAGYRNVLSLAGGIDAWSCEVDASIPRY